MRLFLRGRPHCKRPQPYSRCVTALLLLIVFFPYNLAAADDRPTTLVHPPWHHCYGLHRVTQMHLNAYSGYRKKFRSPQGIAAVKLAANDAPGRRDDDELTVYGINAGTGEIIYNTSLLSIDFYDAGAEAGKPFLRATGIAADRQGLVVVGDTGNDRVVFLRNESNSLRFQKEITLAERERRLRAPRGVAIEDDSVYVADSGNNRIVVLNRTGAFVHAINPIPPLEEPFGIAVISGQEWNHYNSSFMVVTDSLCRRVLRLALDGTVEAATHFSEISDRGGGFFFPAIDYYSNVYLSDTLGGCIYKFDKSLTFLTRTNCDPGWDIQLEEPRGLALYRRFGQLFVAERSGASYFWIGTDIRHLRCQAEPMQTALLFRVRFLLTEHSILTITLETEGGEKIKSFVQKRFTEPGTQLFSRAVPLVELPENFADCTYIVTVTAQPTYSSKKYLTVEKRVPARIQG